MLLRRRERFRNRGNDNKYSTPKDASVLYSTIFQVGVLILLKAFYLQLLEKVLYYNNLSYSFPRSALLL
jgi:hypothetical protein